MKNSYAKKYVVLGPGHGTSAGRIKTIPLAGHINSTLVDFKDGVARISTREEKAKTGTVFIETLYEQEGRLDLLDAFMAHRDAIEHGRLVLPFPDSMLPKKVLEWQKGAGAQEPFDPEAYLAEKKAAAKAEKKKPEDAAEKKAG